MSAQQALTVHPSLRAMLAEPIDAGPLWGSHGFPYTCGVTPRGFTLWALAPSGMVDETLQWATSVGTLMKHFCHDCPLAQREQAKKAGTCIRSVIANYHGGGRPPQSAQRLDDPGSSSTVRRARAATSDVAPPRGDDGATS